MTLNLLAKVYQCHPLVVGLPTMRRDLYNPPPLTRPQVREFCRVWGRPIDNIPTVGWGYAISPILVAIHLETVGTLGACHVGPIIQHILWGGGDVVLMTLIHLSRVRPLVIPRRTFYRDMSERNLAARDLMGMVHQTARKSWTWTVMEVRDSLRYVDTLTVDWYRLAYLRAR